MQTVDLNEFLGQPKRAVVLVDRVADDAADLGVAHVDLRTVSCAPCPCAVVKVNKPYQLTFSPVSSAGLGRIAGVHSMEWILAITAALISRATLKRRLSSQSG